MKHVALIFTGGTITMRMPSREHGAVPGVDPDEILRTLEASTELQNLHAHHFSSLQSPALDLPTLRRLKAEIDGYIEDDDYAGVVVVQGTDTLEESAFYLDATHDSDKPVVLTGAMKNASELGYDGLTNLASSIRTVRAPDSRRRGVLVVMNYQIHAAAEVMKTHTLNLDTFKSLDFGPVGIIDSDEVLYYRSLTLHKSYRLPPSEGAWVELLKVYAGMDGSPVERALAAGVRGIVLEATGRGNVPPAMMQSIKKAREAGVEIVIASRVPAGRVLDSYGYEGGGKDLARAGCLLAGTLSGLKARILLSLALAAGYDRERIAQLFTH